jgi:hypothetical protein
VVVQEVRKAIKAWQAANPCKPVQSHLVYRMRKPGAPPLFAILVAGERRTLVGVVKTTPLDLSAGLAPGSDRPKP